MKTECLKTKCIKGNFWVEKMVASSSRLSATSGQFHQCFSCPIFVQNFGAKNFKPKIQLLYEILAPKMSFRTKNARVKHWWNWHQVVEKRYRSFSQNWYKMNEIAELIHVHKLRLLLGQNFLFILKTADKNPLDGRLMVMWEFLPW
jgi:hypothetical protein